MNRHSRDRLSEPVPEVRNGGIRLLQTKDIRYGTMAIRFFQN